MADNKEDSLLKRIKKQASIGIEANHNNMETYYKSQTFLFTRDGQFDPEELEYFTRHRKPRMVANRLIIEYYRMVGAQRKLKRNVELKAIGGYSTTDNKQADQVQAKIELRQKILETISCHSEANKIYEDAFASAYFGVGWWRVCHKYDDNSFDQSIYLKPGTKPEAVYWDINAKDPLKITGDYMGYWEDMSADEIENEYDVDVKDPELKQGEIGDSSASFAWMGNQGTDEEYFRVCHHYYKKYYHVKIALLTDGRNKVVCDLKECESKLKELNEQVEQQESQMGMQLPRYTKVQERVEKRSKIKEVIFCGTKILQKSRDFIVNKFPICLVFPIGYYGKDGKFNTIPISYFGEDVQRLQNFALCALVESLVRYRTERFLMEKQNLPENSNELQKWLNPDQQNGVMVFQPSNAFQRPEIIPNQEIPQSVLQGVNEISALFNDVIGRSPTSQMSPGGLNSSGDMVDSIAREDIQVGSLFMDNLERAIEYSTQVESDMIPEIYDAYRTISVNNGDSPQTFAINDEMNPNTMIGDENYDVKMTVGPAFELQRQQTADFLLKLLSVPSPVPLITLVGDLIAKNTDINEAQEISDRLNFVLDPRILQKLNIQLPQLPPQPNPQMMEMQLKQKELQLKQSQIQAQQQQAALDNQSKQAQQQLDMRKQQLDEEMAMLDYQMNLMKLQQDGQANQMQAQTEAMRSRAEVIKAVESTHSAIHTASINSASRGAMQ